MAENTELKNNLNSFRKKFKDYTDYYTVIGGTACMILNQSVIQFVKHKRDNFRSEASDIQ